MAEYRTIKMSFWADPFIEGLSSDAKLLYFYLFTCSHTNNLGILEITRKKIANETGLSEEVVNREIGHFVSVNKAVVDGYKILLLRFIRNQTAISTNLIQCLQTLLDKEESKLLKWHLYAAYPDIFGGLPMGMEAPSRGIDTPSSPSTPPRVLELELELEDEYEVKEELKDYCPSLGPSLFTDSQRETTSSEKEMLRLLSEVVGRKYDYNADLAQIRTLSVEFPAVDMLAEVRKMKDWLSEKKNLRAGRGNPRLFMRNWISRAAESSRYKTPSKEDKDTKMAGYIQQAEEHNRKMAEKYGIDIGGDALCRQAG